MLETINFAHRNESDVITYTVSSIGGTPKTYEINATTAEIKSEIRQKINKRNYPVRTEGAQASGNNI